jgi:hypothetical protein
MKLTIDRGADALYLDLDDATARRLEQLVNEARAGHREVEITAFA